MKIVDSRTVISFVITFCLLTVFFAFNNNFSYAISLNNPIINSFDVQDGEDNALRIEFSSNNSGYDYSYELYNVTTNKKNVLAGSSNFYVYQNLKSDTIYNVKIRVCSNDFNSYVCSKWISSSADTTKTDNGKDDNNELSVPNFKGIDVLSSSSVKLNYYVNGKSLGVEIKNITDNKDFKTTNNNSFVVSNLKANKEYSFKIRSYVKQNNQIKYSDYSLEKDIKTTGYDIKIPSVSKISSKDSMVTIKLKKVGKVTGVQIYNITGKKKVNTKKNSYTFKNLKEGKTYKFKLRSYYKKSGETYYSKYTSIKSIKVKGLAASELIARTAEKLAWKYGTSKSIWHHNYSTSRKFKSWNDLGKARPNKEFQKALDKEKPGHFNGSGGYAVGADCGVFVNTVLRYSGHDKKMKYGKLDSYFDKDSRWKKVSKAKRGDVCITRYSGGMHTKIYLGNGKSAEAAHFGKNFGHVSKSNCNGYKLYRAIK